MAKLFVVGIDTLAVAFAVAAAALVCQTTLATPEAMTPVIVTSALSLPVWLCVFARYKLYSAAAVTSVTAEVRRVVHAVAAGSVCMALVGVLLGAQPSRAWLALTFCFALLSMLTGRTLVRRAFRRARARGQLNRRVLIVGANAEALAVAEMLAANRALGYEVLGVLDCDDEPHATPPLPLRVYGSWRDAVQIARSLDITGVIVATSSIDVTVTNRIVRELIEFGYHVELTSGLVDISAARLLPRALGRRPVMYVEPVHRVGWRAAAKRVFDIVVSAGLLVLAAPAIAVAAVAIKLDSPGRVFFSQLRVGRNGKVFRIWKLRTMRTDAEEMLDELRSQSDVDGPRFKMSADPRVTDVGRLLRRTSVDEIPQLWNVLRGEMSIVGPRPALTSEASGWSDEVHKRLRAKPGITGMWQVNGRSSSSFDDYVRHDLYYVDNWTLLTDLAIVAKTIPVVLSRRGAY